ncbi:2,4'-dihydroxyacetophenone dioxygenase family protein [Caulobacter segnis]|uniref:2,4'-dihydroxyacetophenone dioxygenase family protein n=1 Tax=Caulobacter segnis TaxID=88688 RepID=UPI0026892529|nr:2,4'-dihydroxyacetophenone dioxygenase family protein [Caulobacter segnis]
MNQVAAPPVAPPTVFPVGFAPSAETLHLGGDDLPWIPVGEGVDLQLLHVDLNQGLWINRTRLKPGTAVPTHFHAGMVLAVTLQGRWFYQESPNQVNSTGSYLFEPAGSVHTLQAAADQSEDTIAWFAIWGPNINIDGDRQVTAVIDAHAILTLYRAQCAGRDLDCSKLIVVGGHGA